MADHRELTSIIVKDLDRSNTASDDGVRKHLWRLLQLEVEPSGLNTKHLSPVAETSGSAPATVR